MEPRHWYSRGIDGFKLPLKQIVLGTWEPRHWYSRSIDLFKIRIKLSFWAVGTIPPWNLDIEIREASMQTTQTGNPLELPIKQFVMGTLGYHNDSWQSLLYPIVVWNNEINNASCLWISYKAHQYNNRLANIKSTNLLMMHLCLIAVIVVGMKVSK